MRQIVATRETPITRPDELPPSSEETPLFEPAGRFGLVSTLDCLEETFAELSNSFTTLHQNFQGIKQVHESLNDFNKSFSGFLYGIKMNAHCIEFSEAPTKETFTSFIQKREAVLLKENKSTPIATPVRRIKTPTPVSRIRTPAQPPPPKKKKINKALVIKVFISRVYAVW
ncbi:4629_t:CDS:2 [Racocetra fulgida]|uniref:DASH complex subunit DAM1 n=1 Tax=Racocetra fulgida TaxID=60492 RepID=A0A9N8ZDX4_9GLOM|nr:4629_t:CDS:2 [Racocetra fulgida]